MPPRKAAQRRRRTAASVHAAAARAVERVLSSEESFALLIRRLERAGWHIERPAVQGGAGSLDTAAAPALNARRHQSG